jgi:hypothetical protein
LQQTGFSFGEFKSGELFEKNAALKPSQHLLNERQRKSNKTCAEMAAAGPSGCTLTSNQQTSNQRHMGDSLM